jgi:hypothetical protein
VTAATTVARVHKGSRKQGHGGFSLHRNRRRGGRRQRGAGSTTGCSAAVLHTANVQGKAETSTLSARHSRGGSRRQLHTCAHGGRQPGEGDWLVKIPLRVEALGPHEAAKERKGRREGGVGHEGHETKIRICVGGFPLPQRACVGGEAGDAHAHVLVQGKDLGLVGRQLRRGPLPPTEHNTSMERSQFAVPMAAQRGNGRAAGEKGGGGGLVLGLGGRRVWRIRRGHLQCNHDSMGLILHCDACGSLAPG